MSGVRLTAGLTVAVVAVLTVGLLAAVHLGRDLRTGPVATAASTSAAAPAGPSTTVLVGSSTAAAPSTNQTVQLSAAAGRHPRAGMYQIAIQSLFDAINAHDYDAWSGTVTGPESRQQDRAAWTRAYSSTADSTITVLGIDDTRVQVSFVSTQDVDLAPAALPTTCIDWTLTYAMEQRDGRWVVGATVPGSVTMSSCA